MIGAVVESLAMEVSGMIGQAVEGLAKEILEMIGTVVEVNQERNLGRLAHQLSLDEPVVVG